MMLAPEGPAALPLWINGHAFLTITKNFHTVTSPSTGKALRLVPLCGADELQLANTAAIAARSGWAASPQEMRDAILEKIAADLESYAAHFAKILQEETSLNESSAQAEIHKATQALRDFMGKNAPSNNSAVIQMILSDATEPFAKPVQIIAEALASGCPIIIKTSVKAPSALFALAELSARANIPSGVLNLLHGDDEIITAIGKASELTRIVFVGEAAMAEKISALLNPYQKQLVLA